jgi:UDP-N-acetylglucosamine 2-epimerase (non-hydrolysing)
MKKKILCVIGTRPEVIKMAPIITILRHDKDLRLSVLSTAQHREMLDQMLNIFQIVPDIDLNLMEANQTLPQLTSRLPLPLDRALLIEKPDIVLAQGDTTTAFLMSLACFYEKIPFGHVEAGLRTGNLFYPFPEEMNRSLISKLSTLNFAPTDEARQNLLNEGYDPASIFVTGNTVIDALNIILKKEISVDPRVRGDKKLLLVTAHRRENLGPNLLSICQALRTIADNNRDVQILYAVHPNPQVKSVVHEKLSRHPQIILTEPLPYESFVKLMQEAYLILCDSGGVQEEAPFLGTPVLVLRDETERPEAVKMGASLLVGTKSENIIKNAQILLDNEDCYKKMIVKRSLYGDGTAGKKIVEIVKDYLLR